MEVLAGQPRIVNPYIDNIDNQVVDKSAASTRPARRIAVSEPCFNGNEKKYLIECIDSTWISSDGKFVHEFERQFAQYCQVKHALSCSNGTVALHLALLAHGIEPGDEVIVPTLTYIATANAVMYCNAKPVFVDSEPDTWNLSAASIEAAITEKTKGIIVVHLYGHPVDMDAIIAIAKRHNLFIIEDAAEAHGALYKGRKVGSIGHSATFSFYGNKIITSGEGGAVVTNDSAIADKVRLLKGQGMSSKRYWFEVIGYNYRMTNLQAAVALAQLENIEWLAERRKEVARWYHKDLNGIDSIVLPIEKPWAKHAYWMYTILLRDGTETERDQLMDMLAKDGIETRPVFYPLHIMPPYAEMHRKKNAAFHPYIQTQTQAGNDFSSLPEATAIAASGINLPTHAILTKEDVQYVSSRIKHHLGNTLDSNI